MKLIHLPLAMREDYYTINVVFDNQGGSKSQPYTYKVHKGISLEVLDEVVVPTQYGIKVAQVWSIDAEPNVDYNFKFEYNWIIQKIDKKLYNELVKFDQKIIEAGRKCEHKTRQMQARQMAIAHFGEELLKQLNPAIGE